MQSVLTLQTSAQYLALITSEPANAFSPARQCHLPDDQAPVNVRRAYAACARQRANETQQIQAGSGIRGTKMMDGFHWTDMLALLALGLLIFGPKRLPELGRSVGSALREFRRALSDMGGGAPSQVNTITDSVRTAPGETETSAPAEPIETGKQGETQQQETGPP